MSSMAPTRSALLARKNQLKTARQGRELLEQKKDALWHELRKSMKEAAVQTGDLQRQLLAAETMLLKAIGQDGVESLRSLSFMARQDCSIQVQKKNIAGVNCPLIQPRRFQRHVMDRGVSLLGVSPYFDLAALYYEKSLEFILQQAEMEIRLRRLAYEIRKVTNRVNALAQIVEPRLSREQKIIALALEESEREEGSIAKRFAKRGRTTASSNPCKEDQYHES